MNYLSDRLEGPRIVLRQPRLDDAEALFESVGTDPEISQYMLWTPHDGVERTQQSIINQIENPDMQSWVGTVDGIVGGLCVCWFRARHSVELAGCVRRSWWRMGYAAEAMGLILTELRTDPEVYRVSATCDLDNKRTPQLLERFGFSLEGRLARYAIYPNLGPEPRDSLLYAMALR